MDGPSNRDLNNDLCQVMGCLQLFRILHVMLYVLSTDDGYTHITETCHEIDYAINTV
jgi:hypothetical protein